MANEQQCWKCGKTKPLTNHHFHKDKNRPTGFVGRCKVCVAAYEVAYREKPGIKTREAARKKTYHARPEVKAHCKVVGRANWLKRQYGITPEEWQARFEKQGGVCAICRKLPGGRTLVVDHDHKTGRFRGLLCDACNGFLVVPDREGPAVLNRARRYLQEV